MAVTLPTRYATDSTGWIRVTDADATVHYVSDSLATQTGNNGLYPTQGAGTNGPFKTCAEALDAFAALTKGAPHWLLFREGDSWDTPLGQIKQYGRFNGNPATQNPRTHPELISPIVIATYHESVSVNPATGAGLYPGVAARPKFDVITNNAQCWACNGSGGGSLNDGNFLAMLGLDFGSSVRDPASATFDSTINVSGGGNANPFDWNFYEDCRCEFLRESFFSSTSIDANPSSFNWSPGRSGVLFMHRVSTSHCWVRANPNSMSFISNTAHPIVWESVFDDYSYPERLGAYENCSIDNGTGTVTWEGSYNFPFIETTDDVLTDGMPDRVFFQSSGTLPSPLSANTRYIVRNVNASPGTFQVQALDGSGNPTGDIITSMSGGSGQMSCAWHTPFEYLVFNHNLYWSAYRKWGYDNTSRNGKIDFQGCISARAYTADQVRCASYQDRNLYIRQPYGTQISGASGVKGIAQNCVYTEFTPAPAHPPNNGYGVLLNFGGGDYEWSGEYAKTLSTEWRNNIAAHNKHPTGGSGLGMNTGSHQIECHDSIIYDWNFTNTITSGGLLTLDVEDAGTGDLGLFTTFERSSFDGGDATSGEIVAIDSDPASFVHWNFRECAEVSISGTTLTVTHHDGDGTLAANLYVYGTGVAAGTQITGGSGLIWTVNISQEVSATSMDFSDGLDGEYANVEFMAGPGGWHGSGMIATVTVSGGKVVLVDFDSSGDDRGDGYWSGDECRPNYPPPTGVPDFRCMVDYAFVGEIALTGGHGTGAKVWIQVGNEGVVRIRTPNEGINPLWAHSAGWGANEVETIRITDEGTGFWSGDVLEPDPAELIAHPEVPAGLRITVGPYLGTNNDDGARVGKTYYPLLGVPVNGRSGSLGNANGQEGGPVSVFLWHANGGITAAVPCVTDGGYGGVHNGEGFVVDEIIDVNTVHGITGASLRVVDVSVNSVHDIDTTCENAPHPEYKLTDYVELVLGIDKGDQTDDGFEDFMDGASANCKFNWNDNYTARNFVEWYFANAFDKALLPSAEDFGSTVLGDHVLDNGLSVLATDPDQILVCSAEPDDYADAQTLALGVKDYGAGNLAFASIGAGSPDGRKTSLNEITDGEATATGKVTHWAAVDSINSRLLVKGQVENQADVTDGGVWGMASLDITIRSG